MRFICETSKITEAILNTQRAVSTKTSLPSLAGILITATGGNVVLSGYDLEIAITTKVEARVLEEGNVILDASLFSEMLRRVPAETVDITVDDKSVAQISSGSYQATITGIPGIEYPELPTVTDGINLTLQSDMLRSMITQTVYAVAENDLKPAHTGIMFEIEESTLRLIAVDGYRLAIRKEQIKESGNMRFIVPKKALMELVKLMGEEDKEIIFHIGRRHILFEIGDFVVISRLLEGEFLDFRNAVPEGQTTELIVNTRSLIGAIDRLSLLIIDRLKSPVRCKIEKGDISLKCTTTRGKAQDNVSCEQTGEKVELGFNHKYFIEALRATDTDSVRIQFNGALSPIKIMPMEGESFLFLVLPVRLKAEAE